MGVFDGVLGGAIGAAGSIWNNERNIAFQRETNEHNEALMREAWGREDSAVQRRAADMDAAGFNPVLATGAAASTMPAVRAEPPQARENVGRSAAEGYRNAVDISLTQAQAELVRQQARNQKAEADLKTGTFSDEYNVPYTWMSLKSREMLAATAAKEYEGRSAEWKSIYMLPEYEAAKRRMELEFWQEHKKDFLDLELEGRKNQWSKEQLELARQKLANELLEKNKDFFTADKIFSYIGSLTGSAARIGTLMW